MKYVLTLLFLVSKPKGEKKSPTNLEEIVSTEEGQILAT